MDTSAPDITFDEKGHCNYCCELLEKIAVDQPTLSLEKLVEMIRSKGRSKPYDCIVGVSGGVDSSYTLHLVKKLGLRPLAVHLDNGWNSEVAIKNIALLVRSLNVDLYTHVIDWQETKDLQRSLIKANVVDIEMLMDNAIQATNYIKAKQYGLKYILAGTNTATEGMRMPPGWVHCKLDKKNICTIHKEFGSVRLKTHPLMSTKQIAWNRIFRGIRWIPFLDLVDYKKDEALQILKNEHGYHPYPYKHYESVFTRFYQGHILPEKFGIDKRRVHFSTLIITGQMERSVALEKLKESPYPSHNQLEVDYEFVLKKLGFSEAEFEEYLSAPKVLHSDYASEEWFFRMMVEAGRRFGVER